MGKKSRGNRYTVRLEIISKSSYTKDIIWDGCPQLQVVLLTYDNKDQKL